MEILEIRNKQGHVVFVVVCLWLCLCGYVVVRTLGVGGHDSWLRSIKEHWAWTVVVEE